MMLVLCMDHLRRGIRVFKSRPKWNRDFHNAMYRDLLAQKTFDAHYWRRIVDELGRWQAYRPCPRGLIESRGLEALVQLRAAYTRIIAGHAASEPDLGAASWEELRVLFGVAWRIKGVDSPVFASKMCHFILPDCFPVLDNPLMDGIRCWDYPTYWQACRDGWLACPNREELIEELRGHIGSDVFCGYPWGAKITELCAWGLGEPIENHPPVQPSGRHTMFECERVEVGDVLISHKKGYHYVVTQVDGDYTQILWIERLSGEPQPFEYYSRDIKTSKATSYYDLIKKAKVPRPKYSTPPGGWPE